MVKWQKSRANPSPVPGVIAPLLPTLVRSIPEGKRWLHEIKWDGYRIGVYLDHDQVRIVTRNLFDWTERFPTIRKAVSKLNATEAVIDGEAIVSDDKGLSSFAAIQQALGRGGRAHDITFVAFDLLRLDGEDLRQKPLEERRALLIGLLGEPMPEGILFSDEIEGDPDQLMTHACRLGLEGIVSKLRDSPYRSGRRMEWVKTKCVMSDEFIAIGYVPGKGYGGLGKVLLAKPEDGKLIPAGGVGTGFNSRTGPDMRRRLDVLAIDSPPIPKLREKGAVWTRPELVLEVEYRGWTEDKALRHPSFKGVREDRTPEEFGL
jgi:DNA polymerase LigD, ligase domain